jgi:hypothetical protein
MSTLIRASVNPSYYKRFQTERTPRVAPKIPNKKARFAEVVNGRLHPMPSLKTGDWLCSGSPLYWD